MIIRQIQEKDIEKLKQLHKDSGFDYAFPDLKEFWPIPAVVDSSDSPIMVVASLPTVELFLFVDSEWETPGMRMEAFKLIHEFVRKDLNSRGVVEATAWLPPQLGPAFQRRLINMGWNKNREDWVSFSRRTDHV